MTYSLNSNSSLNKFGDVGKSWQLLPQVHIKLLRKTKEPAEGKALPSKKPENLYLDYCITRRVQLYSFEKIDKQETLHSFLCSFNPLVLRETD